MAEQLQYCTSIQFFNRCRETTHNNNSRNSDSYSVYFRSRVEETLKRCLNDANESSIQIHTKEVLESKLKVIRWEELFANHCDVITVHDNIRTALIEVLFAVSNVLSKSKKSDFGVAFVFLLWAYHRAKPDDAETFTWSTVDAAILQFIEINFAETARMPLTEAIKTCTSWISNDIKAAFKADQCDSREDNDAIVISQKNTINDVKSLVQLLRDLIRNTDSLSDAISNALLMILCTLDDVDISNLQCPSNSNDLSKNSMNFENDNRIACRKYRRLPQNVRSSDVIEAIHDTSLDLGDVFRHQRSKRMQMEHETCPGRQVTLKLVLNEQVSNENGQSAGEVIDEYGENFRHQSSRISTLSVEAAYLRRELYLYLIQIDSAYIKQETTDSDSMLTKLVYALLLRLESYSSPAARLYTVLTLDNLRELHLGDRGYTCLMGHMLKLISLQHDARSAFALKLYTEIVSECDVYVSPKRLIPAVSNLMEIVLCPSTKKIHAMILHSIAQIMVRRKNVMSRYNCDDDMSAGNFADEINNYKDLTKKVATVYDEPSFWISQSMNNNDCVELIAFLQAIGILSLFQNYDNICQFTKKKERQLMFDGYSSLRSTHQRMGPCQGFNDILTASVTYRCTRTELASHITKSNCGRYGNIDSISSTPLSKNFQHDDILHGIFDFLPYRSLLRASQCCRTWQGAARSNERWLRNYFRRFKGSIFEEELLGSNCHSNLNKQADLLMALDGHDWFVIFKNHYVVRKARRSRYVGQLWKPRICHCVGCNVLISSERHMTNHLNMHIKQAHVNATKRAKLKEMKASAIRLRQMLRTSDISRSFQKEFKPSCNQAAHIDSPQSLLTYLVFPFLDLNDIVHPICKLWTTLSQADLLWYNLYCHHFGVPYLEWSTVRSTSNHWKAHFRSMHQATRFIRGNISRLGYPYQICPVLGCSSVLESKLEFDLHLTKHEVKWLNGLYLSMRKKRRSNGRLGLSS